jgi:hypothetical protein
MSHTQKYMQLLKIYLGRYYKPFHQALKESKCIIAGGSLTSSIGCTQLNDFDIYVNRVDSSSILKFFIDGGIISHCHTSSGYCTSFMKRNHIFVRFEIHMGSNTFDLMVVDNGITLQDVVMNFDLSFCKIWYDPIKGVDGPGINDAKEKKGTLSPDYLKTFFSGNIYTHKRILKYMQRGYEVNINAVLHHDDIKSFEDTKERESCDEMELLHKIILYTLSPSSAIRFFYITMIDMEISLSVLIQILYDLTISEMKISGVVKHTKLPTIEQLKYLFFGKIMKHIKNIYLKRCEIGNIENVDIGDHKRYKNFISICIENATYRILPSIYHPLYNVKEYIHRD